MLSMRLLFCFALSDGVEELPTVAVSDRKLDIRTGRQVTPCMAAFAKRVNLNDIVPGNIKRGSEY